MKKIRFLLVGPGNVGISLAAAWVRAGHVCVDVEGGRPVARAQTRSLLGIRARRGGSDLGRPGFDLLLIAVPDRCISQVARSWAGRVPWTGKTVLHTSGVIGASALSPLRRQGASVGSLHPLRSLPRPMPGRDTFREIFFGIQGDRQAARVAGRLAREIGGKTIQVRRDLQALYHLGACLSSGYLLGLIDAAATRIGVSAANPRRFREALLALAETTLRTAREKGLERSLTGPIVRGDLIAIRAHLTAMESLPLELRELHRTLALHTLNLAAGSRRTPPALAARTRRLFKKK